MTKELTFDSLDQKKSFICRLKSSVRQNLWLFWAFLIPSACLLAIHFMFKVYPVGNNSVLVLDLNAQYVYFYEELRDILRGDGSLLYSWQRSLGGEFMGMYAYYVASPFNFIVALFPEGHITEALLTIFVLKAGLCGFNFALFLKLSKRLKNKVGAIIFSTMYALCAYAIVNSHNSMWMDAVLFLPLLIYALEKLINEKKFILYTLLLAVILIANYYIGYMVCIFIFIYSVYYYFSIGRLEEYNVTKEKCHIIKAFLRVLFYSVLAISIAAVVILCAYYSLKFGKNEFSDPNYDWKTKFDIFNMFGKFLPGSYDTVRPEGLPFVYCGTLALLLIPAYFINGKIDYREKIGSFAVCAVLMASFNISPVDMFWHGLQNPNWLNYRYSFLLVFMMLCMAHHSFTELRHVKTSFIVGTGGLLLLFTFVLQKFGLEYVREFRTVWFSVAAISVLTIMLYFVRRNRVNNLAAIILAITVTAELLISSLITLDDLDNDVVISTRDSYRNYIDKYTEPIAEVKKKDPGFYRMEAATHRKPNDNMALDINGITSSTSTLNASVIKLMNQFGYASKSHWTKYLGGCPVSDSLLGIKYVFYSGDYKGNTYEKIADDGAVRTYYNPYALSAAFAVSARTERFDFFSDQTPFEMFNKLVSDMIGNGKYYEIFHPIASTETYVNCKKTYATSEYLKYTPVNASEKATIHFQIENVPTNGEMYLFFPSDYPREVSISYNYKDIGTFFGNETDRIVALGNGVKGDRATLSVTLKKDRFYLHTDEFFFYYLDEQTFKEAMELLAKDQLEISEYSDTRLYGNINVSRDNAMIFTSIPYDEGWHIFVDGEETPFFKVGDALIGFNAEKGAHTVEMKYRSDAFVYGGTISLIGLATFIALAIFEILSNRKKKKAETVPAPISPADGVREEGEKTETESPPEAPAAEDETKEEAEKTD